MVVVVATARWEYASFASPPRASRRLSARWSGLTFRGLGVREFGLSDFESALSKGSHRPLLPISFSPATSDASSVRFAVVAVLAQVAETAVGGSSQCKVVVSELQRVGSP